MNKLTRILKKYFIYGLLLLFLGKNGYSGTFVDTCRNLTWGLFSSAYKTFTAQLEPHWIVRKQCAGSCWAQSGVAGIEMSARSSTEGRFETTLSVDYMLLGRLLETIEVAPPE